MRMRPELKILKEMSKKLEKLELNQYLILNSLIPKVKPSKEERKIIVNTIRAKKFSNENQLFKVLRK